MSGISYFLGVRLIFSFSIMTAGLVSCSSSSEESGLTPEPSGAREIQIGEDGGNNPFAFKKEDIQQAENGSITGGKRSQFSTATESAYAKANREVPTYLQSSYQKAAWSGGKDYRTGSYETSSSQKAEKKSWFGGRKSSEAAKVASASRQDFSTGSFQTGSANESGRSLGKKSSAYAESRSGNAWARKPVILSEGEYRSISRGQAKTLLGR